MVFIVKYYSLEQNQGFMLMLVVLMLLRSTWTDGKIEQSRINNLI